MAKLTLTNWGVHKRLELPLDHPLTLIVGDHETGKSMVLDGLTFLFTGTLLTRPGIEHKKEIGEWAIREGEKKGGAQLRLPGGLQIVRNVDRAGKQSLVVHEDGEAVEGVKDGQAAIYTALGLDEGQALAALHSWRFLNLGRQEQKDLLFRALGHAMTEEKIRKAMVERGLSEERFGDLRLPEKAAREGFRSAEQFAIEKRREAGRHLEGDIGEPDRVVTIGDREMDLEQVVEAEVEKRIRDLRVERDRALRTGGEVVGGAKRMLEELRPQVEALTQKINGTTDDAFPDPTPLIEEKQQLEEALPAKELELTVLDQQIGAARAVAEAASTMKKPEVCEAFGVACLATQAAIKKALGPIRQKAAEAKKSLEKLGADRARIASELDIMRSRIESLGNKVADLANERNAVENSRATLRELNEKVRGCEQVLRENEGVEETSVSDLDTRIGLNQRLLDEAGGYREAKAVWQEQAATLAQHREDHQAWDAIAQALKPDGIEADLLRELLPAFVDKINSVANATHVGLVSFDEEMRLRVQRPNAQIQAIPQLSRSARHRLSISIQHGFASLTGFPLLVVDELDLYNYRLQAPVVSALLEHAAEYPAGILGLATLKTEVPRRPPSEKVAMWWLRDGELVGVE